ncbi:MAG: hypothetical protein ACPHID_01645 [Thermoplasmatota archaeon]
MNWTPLAKKAYEQIRANGPLNNMDLLERLSCSRRGLYTVLQELVAEGALRRHPDLRDMRRHLYTAAH